jgi:acetoin utilization protein AcuB
MPVLEAAALMKEKGIERLPIEENGKLVGIVTKDRVLRAAPSSATSLSLHEMHYLFAKLKVGEIMQKNVSTVEPDTTVEAAVSIAQKKGVGCLPVTENGHVVGILTTNDFFYLVLNPVLGIGVGGSRIIVRNCNGASGMQKALTCVVESGCSLTNAAYIPSRTGEENDVLMHITEENPTPLLQIMKANGLDAEARQR